LGLLWNLPVAHADSDSLLIADYGPLEFTLVHSISPAIVTEINRDQSNCPGTFDAVGNPELVSYNFWAAPTELPTANMAAPTPPISEPTATMPTSTSTVGVTETPIPIDSSTPN